jgi:hypothetical protein
MDFNRIVWTAVLSMALAVGSIIAGLQNSSGGDSLALSFGLSSIALATLSARERR